MKRKRVEEIFKKFQSVKIGVVGDIMLDRYLYGDTSRISPEAPVPIVGIKDKIEMLGGSGNVAKNIISLGGKPILAGVFGKDSGGKKISEILENSKIDRRCIFEDDKRITTVKTRVISQNQQVVRFDCEKRDGMSNEFETKIVNGFSKNIDSLDIIIVSDYGKGVITKTLMENLISLSGKFKKPILVDPFPPHVTFYKGITGTVPNLHEIEKMLNQELDDEDSIERAGKILKEVLNCQFVLITRGKDGMSLFWADTCKHIKTFAKEVFDVTGAGDTVIASFSLSLGAGASPLEAALISNYCGGIVVKKLGSATVTQDDILREFEEEK